jgi:hypothetical protein
MGHCKLALDWILDDIYEVPSASAHEQGTARKCRGSSDNLRMELHWLPPITGHCKDEFLEDDKVIVAF